MHHAHAVPRSGVPSIVVTVTVALALAHVLQLPGKVAIVRARFVLLSLILLVTAVAA